MIRFATVLDVGAINTIINHYIEHSATIFDLTPWSDHQRCDWYNERFTKITHYYCYACTHNSNVVGVAYNSPFMDKKAYRSSTELSIYLHPDHTGKGLASALYNQLITHLGTNGHFHKAYARITQPNPASNYLHQQFGFTLIGTLNECGYKFGQYHNVSLYEKAFCSQSLTNGQC